MLAFFLLLISVSLVLWVNFVSARYDHRGVAEKEPSPAKLFSNFFTPLVRGLVPYVTVVSWTIGLYYFALVQSSDTTEIYSKLVRYLGLTALFLLFLVLVPGLVEVYFPRFALNNLLLTARKSIGFMVIFFALFHAVVSFLHNFR